VTTLKLCDINGYGALWVNLSGTAQAPFRARLYPCCFRPTLRVPTPRFRSGERIRGI